MDSILRTFAVHFCEDCTAFFARLESTFYIPDYQIFTTYIKLLHCIIFIYSRKRHFTNGISRSIRITKEYKVVFVIYTRFVNLLCLLVNTC